MKSFKLFAEEASPMIKPPNNEFATKADAFAHAKKHGGKVMMKTFIHPTTGMKNVSYVVKEDVEDVAEGGPFSYGSKPPRKGSVAYNAMMKRKEQEKGKPPIEPKDQMVGTAKVVKESEFKYIPTLAGPKYFTSSKGHILQGHTETNDGKVGAKIYKHKEGGFFATSRSTATLEGAIHKSAEEAAKAFHKGK